jgi:hypothetical protein
MTISLYRSACRDTAKCPHSCNILCLVTKLWRGQTNGLNNNNIVIRVLSLHKDKAVFSEQSGRVLLIN